MTRGRAFDVGLVGLLLAATQTEAQLGPYDERLRLSVVCVALVVPLCWRRTRPAVAGVIVAAVFAVGQAATGDLTEMASGTLPLLIASYGSGAFLPTRSAVAVGAVMLATAELSVVTDPSPSSFVYAALMVAAAWGVGRVTAGRQGRVDDLEQQTMLLQQEQDTLARRAVEDERARIARELHDVVAHGVSVMVVQAGAAEGVVSTDPAAAAGALRDIQAAGRQALVELRRMLDLLKSDGGPEADVLAPQPGLDDIPALVEAARAAGLQVDVAIDPLPALPPALALSAYRIVQESLTNAIKHAGPAPVLVRVRNVAGALEIGICDQGRGTTTTAAGGHGLAGMRERVALFGGSLDVTTSPGKGFAVTALLPLGRSA